VYSIYKCAEYSIPNKSIIISIDGNIGSGKSTLVKILKTKLGSNVSIIEEPVQLWQSIQNQSNENILDLFYKDSVRWSYTFQNLAFITRSLVLNNAKLGKNKIILVERSTETDKHVFAKCLYDTDKMSKMEYELYNVWYDKFKHKIDGYIYLQTSPNKCIERIKKRNRQCETKIEDSYIESMDHYHNKWLLDSKMNTLVLDGNDEFIKNINIQTQFCSDISQYIQLLQNK
jgi:deoxyadenosine/deoxycytidine kinase